MKTLDERVAARGKPGRIGTVHQDVVQLGVRELLLEPEGRGGVAEKMKDLAGHDDLTSEWTSMSIAVRSATSSGMAAYPGSPSR